MYRQGDILLVREAMRTGPYWKPTPVAGNVVAFGEVTGHSHRVEDGEVVDVGGIRYVTAGPAGTRLVHDEHETIVLPEGVYRVYRQREFSPEGDRRVAD